MIVLREDSTVRLFASACEAVRRDGQYDRDRAFDRYFAYPAVLNRNHVVAGKWTHTERWPASLGMLNIFRLSRQLDVVDEVLAWGVKLREPAL
jgi:hypothetical protein